MSLRTATLAILIIIAAVAQFAAPAYIHTQQDDKAFREAERLGELYYKALLNFTYPAGSTVSRKRRGERNMRYRPEVCSQWAKVSPDFPCVRGVVPLGDDSKASIDDGHKFACGISFISEKPKPIVYSLGSNRKQDFEIAFLRHRSDAQVWTFDLLESHLPPADQRISSISYNAVGLGGWQDRPIRSKPGSQADGAPLILQPLSEIMRERNHSYIDVLKMDIEGHEWLWILHEPHTLERIGQLLIEVHIDCDNRRGGQSHSGSGSVSGPNKNTIKAGSNSAAYPYGSFLKLLEALEARGLRMFYKELNPMWPESCSEFSFVQKDWGQWEAGKSKLEPLPPFRMKSKSTK